jgi:hypothetical protein
LHLDKNDKKVGAGSQISSLSNVDPNKPAPTTAFQKAREAYRFSDYDLQSFANKTAITSVWIKSHLDVHTIQKIATRAFKALERMAFGKAKKVRFKQKGQFASCPYREKSERVEDSAKKFKEHKENRIDNLISTA